MTLCYTYRIGSIHFAVLWILNGDLTATFEMTDVKYGEHWWTSPQKNPIKYALFMINYFTSCDPHHDIYTFSYWQIFWHSIWHIFWHSIWHIFWHSTWGPAGNTWRGYSRLRSGREHWAWMVVVEVPASGTLGGDGRGWGPAGNTGRGWSWLRSDREHCASRVAVEQEEGEEEEGEERRRGAGNWHKI